MPLPSCAALIAVLFFLQTSPADEALLNAARKGDLEAVKSALASGAAVDAKTRHGVTPLFWAAGNGHLEVVKLLTGKGADINVVDSFYKMPVLAFVIQRKQPAAAVFLLQNGSKQGPAALASAVSEDMTSVVHAIVDSSTKPTQSQLDDALQDARLKHKDDIAAILRKGGAKDGPLPTAQIEPEILSSYAGSYRGANLGDVTLAVKDGKLFLAAMGQSLELGAYDNENFQSLRYSMIKLKFNVTEGKAGSFTLTQGQQKTEFTRLEAK